MRSSGAYSKVSDRRAGAPERHQPTYMNSASFSVSPSRIPIKHNRPEPMLDTIAPSTSTLAERTRCTTALILQMWSSWRCEACVKQVNLWGLDRVDIRRVFQCQWLSILQFALFYYSELLCTTWQLECVGAIMPGMFQREGALLEALLAMSWMLPSPWITCLQNINYNYDACKLYP